MISCELQRDLCLREMPVDRLLNILSNCCELLDTCRGNWKTHKINSRYEMSRNGKRLRVPPRQNNFSLLCFFLLLFFLNYKFLRRESYTYTSTWKTGILLTEVFSETKINAPLCRFTVFAAAGVTDAPGSPENMKTTTLPAKWLFISGKSHVKPRKYSYTSSNSHAIQYFSTTAGSGSCVHRQSIFRIENNRYDSVAFERK